MDLDKARRYMDDAAATGDVLADLVAVRGVVRDLLGLVGTLDKKVDDLAGRVARLDGPSDHAKAVAAEIDRGKITPTVHGYGIIDPRD